MCLKKKPLCQAFEVYKNGCIWKIRALDRLPKLLTVEHHGANFFFLCVINSGDEFSGLSIHLIGLHRYTWAVVSLQVLFHLYVAVFIFMFLCLMWAHHIALFCCIKISINVWGLHDKILILGGYSGGSHEKKLGDAPMSDTASSSQLQNRSTSGQN